MVENGATGKLEPLIGTTQIINPRYLLNRKLLYTLQTWIDENKLRRALHGKPDLEDEPPVSYIFEQGGKIAYVLRDANHRTALNIIKNESEPMLINGIWRPELGRKYGFNIILSKISKEVKADL